MQIRSFPFPGLILAMVALMGCTSPTENKHDSKDSIPTVTLDALVNGVSGVPQNKILVATFSEAMDQTTLNGTTFVVSKSGTPAVVGTVTTTATTASFTPGATYTGGVLYTVTITTGAKSLAGVALASNYVGTFTATTTVDSVAPTLVSTVPAASATGIGVGAPVVAQFSEAMAAASITGSSFTLATTSGAEAVGGTVTKSGTTATFTPTNPLTAGTSYTATLAAGITDLAGNPLAAHTWSFTTAVAVVPTAGSPVPASGATGVSAATNVSATFSTAMDQTTLIGANFSLTQGGTPVTGTVTQTATSITFTPASNLGGSLTYVATLSTGVHALAGTPLAAAYTWSFTTAATSVPLAVVNLNSAGSYVILAKTGISTVATSAITGDIGVSPALAVAITGFSLTAATGYATSSQLLGDSKAYAPDYAAPTPANLTTAVSAMEAAYTDAAGSSRGTPTATELAGGSIGSLSLAPGLYKWGTNVNIATDLTLSGGASDVWIFQIDGDLTLAAAKQVILTGGALAKNVFWQVSGTATLGTTSVFEGTILCMTLIAVETNATVHGRLLAQAAVTLDQATVTEPAL